MQSLTYFFFCATICMRLYLKYIEGSSLGRVRKMKVKNMLKSKQSTYSKYTALSGKNLKQSFLTSLIALAVAIIASLFDNIILAGIFGVISLIIAGAEVVFKLVKGTKESKLDTVLVIVAILIPFCMGEFAIAAFAMSIYKLSGVLISYISGSIGKDLKEIAEVTPKNVNVIDSQSNIRLVSSDSLRNKDKFIVKTGEIIPVDAVITEGFSEFDTSRVHESDCDVSLSAGDKVLAGYINRGSSVTCVAVCDYDESLVMDFNRLADMAESTTTIGEKRFLQISKWYHLGILLLAIVVLLISGFVSGAWNSALLRTSVLLVAATSTSNIIAIPLITSSAIWKLKKSGLVIASTDMLDEIADINCVAFEKDGILTNGVYKISDIYTADGIAENDFLMIAGVCVGGRAHPVSRIFTQYQNEHLTAENVMEFPGKGVECTVMGKTVLCGSESFITECGTNLTEISGYKLYITIDGVVLGAVSYCDAPAENAASDIEELRAIGVEKVVMFSADDDEASKKAFEVSGADEYIANMDSFKRVEEISAIKQEEDATCAYIGTHLSGEQALCEADVGITLINKEENNLEYTKVSLLGKLRTLARAIELARSASGKVEIHFYCASAVKIIITLLGLFGALNAASAITIDALLTMFALFSVKDLLKK